MKNLKFESIVILAGLLLLGINIKFGLEAIGKNERSVNVKGLAEMEVPANVVTWPIAYKLLGNDLKRIYSEIKSSNQIIIDFLKSKGLEKQEIIVNSPNIIDLKADRYSNYKDVNSRYNITTVITVKSNKIDLVRKLISEQSELLRRGIATVTGYEYNVNYEYTELNKIKPQMIEEATKNARKTAEKFAKDSDSELGKIQRASQGQFSISDSDATTPHIKHIRVVTSITYSLED